jgi:hypothetical protein
MAWLALAVVTLTAILYGLLGSGALEDAIAAAYLLALLRDLLTGAIAVVYLLAGVSSRAAEPAPTAR